MKAGWRTAYGPPPGSRPVPVSARRGCLARVSALLGGGRGGGRAEPTGLVLYLHGDLLELRLELPSVVGAEEQLAAAGQDDAQVGLGAATVATVGRGERTRGGQNSSHVASSLARRAVVPGSTSNQAEFVPAHSFSFCCLLIAVGGVGRSRPGDRLAADGGGLFVAGSPACRVCSFHCVGVLVRTCPGRLRFMRSGTRDVSITRTSYRTAVRGARSIERTGVGA